MDKAVSLKEIKPSELRYFLKKICVVINSRKKSEVKGPIAPTETESQVSQDMLISRINHIEEGLERLRNNRSGGLAKNSNAIEDLKKTLDNIKGKIS
jgi:hypothetical protein